MKSKYKNLLVSGCSFTHEPNGDWYPFAWPSILAEKLSMSVTNLAIPGAGNDHISKSVILHIEKNNISPDDTLIMVMWSGVGRIDWITDAGLSNFRSQYPFSYNYDEYNELVLGGNWWNIKKPSHLIQTLIEYSKYQSSHSFTLNSWLAMENLSNYLKVKEFEYYYTSFVNYESNDIKGDAFICKYFDELNKLNLTLDKKNWLKLDATDYYGDWARKNNALDIDDFHPKYPEAQEGWIMQVLIPAMKELKILYDS